MPLYEYHCPKCESDFDELKRMSESDAPQPCPECGTESPRCLSAAAVHGSSGTGRSTGRPAATRCAPSGG